MTSPNTPPTGATGATVEVPIIKKHSRFLKTQKRTVCSVGGAGSGKSWSVGQKLVFGKFLSEHNIGILVCRRTLPSLRTSAYRLMLNLLNEHRIPYRHNKAALEITHPTLRNRIMFRPLDDVEKIKSIEDVNYIWVEEATEITKADYTQLNLRLRAPNPNFTMQPMTPDPTRPSGMCKVPVKNQIFLTFNPTDPTSFLKPMCEKPPKDTAILHTTFRDNPFLTPDYVNQIRNLIHEDQAFYRIYNLGEWAVIANLVYPSSSWGMVPNIHWPQPEHQDPSLSTRNPITRETYSHWLHGFGLDFGFAHSKTALLEVWVNTLHSPLQVYIRLHIYEKDMTNTDLIRALEPVIANSAEGHRSLIIADSARPDNITEIFRAGYNVRACIKGKGSVKTGIDRVKRVHTNILQDSPEIAIEKASYKWREDRKGNVLQEVAKFKDDIMDSERYIIGELLRESGIDLTRVGVLSNMPPLPDDEPRLADLNPEARLTALVRQSREYQDLILNLPRAAKQGTNYVKGVCRDIVTRCGKKGTVSYEALENTLVENLESPHAVVRQRCDEILDVIRTRIRVKVARDGAKGAG